jgi:hypothetical protein
MARPDGRSFSGADKKVLWTWESIRRWMTDRHGGALAQAELRALEVKWRKICAASGWSVKGQ